MKFHRLPHSTAGWETVERAAHLENAHLAVVTEKVRSPAHPAAREWTTAHRKAAVVIAPMTAEGSFILIRQERVPIRTAIWEMPAGQVDDAEGTEPRVLEQTALREMEEETGYTLSDGGELRALGHFFSSPGFTDEVGYLFAARPVVKSSRHELETSIVECREFRVDEIARMIAANEIRDANTLSLWARLLALDLI